MRRRRGLLRGRRGVALPPASARAWPCCAAAARAGLASAAWRPLQNGGDGAGGGAVAVAAFVPAGAGPGGAMRCDAM